MSKYLYYGFVVLIVTAILVVSLKFIRTVYNDTCSIAPKSLCHQSKRCASKKLNGLLKIESSVPAALVTGQPDYTYDLTIDNDNIKKDSYIVLVDDAEKVRRVRVLSNNTTTNVVRVFSDVALSLTSGSTLFLVGHGAKCYTPYHDNCDISLLLYKNSQLQAALGALDTRVTTLEGI